MRGIISPVPIVGCEDCGADFAKTLSEESVDIQPFCGCPVKLYLKITLFCGGLGYKIYKTCDGATAIEGT